MNIFEQASKQKVRFETSQGHLSSDDLWDLPLTSKTGRANLDEIAMGLHRQLKDVSDVVSFVDDVKEPKNIALTLQFDIVKHIIEDRKAVKDKAMKEKESADKKQLILGIIAQKQNAALEGQSVEDLEKMIKDL